MSSASLDPEHPLTFDCAHCKKTGTCSNGENESSCAVCSRAHKLKGPQRGLVCSVCEGTGQAELTTSRLERRTLPLLAQIVASVVLGGTYLLGAFNVPHFAELLAFNATLMGTVTGYYFSQRGRALRR